jgi:hypothetical protein
MEWNGMEWNGMEWNGMEMEFEFSRFWITSLNHELNRKKSKNKSTQCLLMI